MLNMLLIVKFKNILSVRSTLLNVNYKSVEYIRNVPNLLRTWGLSVHVKYFVVHLCSHIYCMMWGLMSINCYKSACSGY